MSFKLDPNPTFPATVQITVPGGESLPLKVVYKHKKLTELGIFMNSAGRSNAEMLEDMVAEVKDRPEGQSNADFLADLVENYPAAASDMLRTYLRELLESRVKN